MPTLSHTVRLSCPVESLFTYYANLENLLLLTPKELGLRIVKADKVLALGSKMLFSTRPAMLPFEINWSFEITKFTQNVIFEETMRKGPFTSWVHRHEFAATSEHSSQVTDTLDFTAPERYFGFKVPIDLVSGKLKEAFTYREAVLRAALEKP